MVNGESKETDKGEDVEFEELVLEFSGWEDELNVQEIVHKHTKEKSNGGGSEVM